MANITVSVTDANNITVQLTPVAAQNVTIDRGVAGNGISSIVPVTISTLQYLRIYYTNGTQQDVGPLTSTAYFGETPITIVGNTISLSTVPINKGGTNAITAAAAIQNLLPSYTGNGSKRLGLNSGATALEWVLDGGGTVTSVAVSGGTTGLTTSGGPITGSGTITLAGTLAVANGGTGVTTSTGTGSVVLSTSPSLVTPILGTPTSGNFSTGTFTWPTFNQNTTGTAAGLSATLVIASGGTNGTATPTAGAVSYGTGTAYAFTAAGTAGQILQSNGASAPTWANLSTLGVSSFSAGTTGFTPSTATTGAVTLAGTLNAVNGGTGQSSYAVGDLLYASSTTALSKLADVATGNALISGGVGVAPAWGKIALTTHVSGVLPTANGGTNLSSFTANGVVYASSTSALATNSALTFDGTNVDLGTVGAKLNFATTGSSTRNYIGGSADGYSLEMVMQRGASQPLSYKQNFSVGHEWGIAGSGAMTLTSTGLGIGTSSPAYKLDVNGTSRMSYGLLIQGSSLTATASQVTVDQLNTTTSRIISWGPNASTAGILYFGNLSSNASVGSASNMVLDSSGNLGLGVTPSAWASSWKVLQNQGGFVGTNSTTGQLIASNSYSDGTNWRYVNTGAATQYAQTSGAHSWSVAPSGTAGIAFTFTQAMTLDASGNLLVGTTTNAASAKIFSAGPILTDWNGTIALRYNVAGSTNSYYKGMTGTSITSGSGRGLHIFNYDADSNPGIQFYPNSYAGQTANASMTLDSSGNLGLGTSSPAGKLTVDPGNTSGTQIDGLRLPKNFTAQANFVAWQQGANGWRVGIPYGDNTYPLAFYYGASTPTASSPGTQLMTLDASGNLLVGATSNSSTSGTGFKVTNPVAGHWDPLVVTSGNNASYSCWDIYSTGAGAYRFYVTTTGVINATSTTITAISDERLKENIRDLDYGLASLMALKPRKFDWKEGKGQDKKNVAGFIAQEFENVFPECVGKSKAGDDGIEYKNINHEALIPTLVKAIQEQQAIIQSLTARITALESA